MEEQNTIVELVDDSGNVVRFDLVMTFDYEGKRYAALLPVDKIDNVEDEYLIQHRLIERLELHKCIGTLTDAIPKTRKRRL